jgi:hypothetical protein
MISPSAFQNFRGCHCSRTPAAEAHPCTLEVDPLSQEEWGTASPVSGLPCYQLGVTGVTEQFELSHPAPGEGTPQEVSSRVLGPLSSQGPGCLSCPFCTCCEGRVLLSQGPFQQFSLSECRTVVKFFVSRAIKKAIPAFHPRQSTSSIRPSIPAYM